MASILPTLLAILYNSDSSLQLEEPKIVMIGPNFSRISLIEYRVFKIFTGYEAYVISEFELD
jgi:hypothetical protein